MLAGTPSLRELRNAAITALQNASLPFAPTIGSNPVNALDASQLPYVAVFDGGRSSSKNSSQKLYRGNVILTLDFEVSVQQKISYADHLDELTDAILQTILTSDTVLKDIGQVTGYTTRPDFEPAVIPLARTIITVSMTTQEKFVATESGDPQALEEFKVTQKTSEDPNENITITINPDQN